MATELGLALANDGHEIHFISYQQPVRLNTFRPNIYFHEVSVPSYPLFDFPPYETALASTLANVVLNHNLDLLHVHYAIPHASSAYFARQMLRKMKRDIPFITTLHGTDITLVGKDASYSHVVAFSINESNAITAVSENLRQETIKSFNIKKPIHVIPNFVDGKRFFKSDKDHFKKIIAPNGERIMVHVSNFRKVKRVEDVVKVFQKVQMQIPSGLLMIGDGPERQKVEDLCRKLGISKDIRFLGKQEPLEEILNVADLFILPSEYESFGLAAVEAMACGVPVISTNVGGLPEVNIQGKTGYLSDVGDIEDMANNALNILKDDATLATFKKAALKNAKRFSIEKIVPQYIELYKKVAGQ